MPIHSNWVISVPIAGNMHTISNVNVGITLLIKTKFNPSQILLAILFIRLYDFFVWRLGYRPSFKSDAYHLLLRWSGKEFNIAFLFWRSNTASPIRTKGILWICWS
jgi:hypothetical protein